MWPGTKKVAAIPRRSSMRSSRGTPTRPPNSPRDISAGEESPTSGPSHTDIASKSKLRQTIGPPGTATGPRR